MANKVEIEIDVDVNNEQAINKLKDQLDDLEDSAEDVEIDVETKKAKQRLEELLQIKKQMQDEGTWGFNVESSQIGREISQLKKQLGEVDDEPIKPKFDDSNAQLGIQNLKDGFQTLKQGASELGQVMGEALESAGKQETNKTFLEMSVGAETAAEKMEEINNVVQKLPGDDTAMQGLLSSAVAKNAKLTSEELQKMGTSAADYFAAMSYYGKSASESQQDMTNYLLAGNTAELERSPILQAHIDKLKEATTVQERSQALAEALGEEGWENMSQQDTFNNKLETFNGMLERGKYNLGGMFQEGAIGVMDFALKLDDATGGLVGMGIAAIGFASPLSDMVMGIGQMGTGLKALKDVGDITGLTGKFGSFFTTLSSGQGIISAITAGYDAMAISEYIALGPLLAIIAGIALLGVAVYEVGKYFGWWTDVGSMIDAISAGIQRLWSAFINNPDVQSFIQGIRDAWASIQPALGWVISQVMSFFGISQGGNFDIVRALIMGIGNAWNSMKARIMLVINVVRTIIGVFQQVLGAVTGFINNVISKFTALPGQISSAISGLTGIITAPFTAAWDTISPIIDGIKNGMDTVSGWFSGAGYEGFSTESVGSEGFSTGDTLNSTLTSIADNTSNSSQVIFNNEFHGIIEESASEYIVNSMNNYIKKQNLIKGV